MQANNRLKIKESKKKKTSNICHKAEKVVEHKSDGHINCSKIS